MSSALLRHFFNLLHSFFDYFGTPRKWLALKPLHGSGVMRRSPHLGQGNNGSGAAQHRSAAPASVPPSTPRGQRNGEELDDIVRSFEEKWQLGLKTCDKFKSPSQNTTAEGKVYQQIQCLYFLKSDKSALHDALAIFDTVALRILPDQQLEALADILRKKIRDIVPISRVGTPSSARNERSKSLRPTQRCKSALKYRCFHTSMLDTSFICVLDWEGIVSIDLLPVISESCHSQLPKLHVLFSLSLMLLLPLGKTTSHDCVFG
jgi:hypothetical protein